MSQNETSDDETGLLTPIFLRKGSRCSRTPGTPSSASSSVVLGQIPEEVLRVWSQLPPAIRLDPSLAAFQREYNRYHQIGEGRCSEATNRDCLVVNMSLETQPIIPKKTRNKDTNEDIMNESQEAKEKPFYRYMKLTILFCCWLVFTLLLMTKSEKIETMHQISIPRGQIRNYQMHGDISSKQIDVIIEGSLLPPAKLPSHMNVSQKYLMLWLELTENERSTINKSSTGFSNYIKKNVSEVWTLPVLPEKLMDIFPGQRHRKVFELENVDVSTLQDGELSINLQTNLESSFAVSLIYDVSLIDKNVGIAYAAIVLVGLYILIIFEVVHRTLAAMLASTMSIAILAALNERPTMGELISWIDVDTLMLLFSMMVLVAVIAETGIFDWLAVFSYRITGGKVWPLVSTLCFFTTFFSSFLDNVTTVLLMTPVTIRLCEVMELNPVPILTAMVMFSNIGGALTPVGDPPNVIISSNHDVISNGIDFNTFTLHMSIGVILVLIAVYAQLRYIFRDVAVLRFDEPQDVQELRHEIAVWQRAAASLSSYSKDENLVRETLLKKVQRLLSQLKKKVLTGSVALERYETTLEELQEKYPIRDKWLLAKSGFTLLFVIVMFFLHSIPNLHLSLGWITLVGVLLLLIIADTEDIDGLMARVEWTTLLFFASLFILMEALSRLGLMDWIGKQTENIILSVNESSRLAVAILLILWVSAIASAFVDNVPLSTMMIRIVTNLARNSELGLPLQPLVWALAFGACMGGNGTLIGASSNVVCVGVAEQHGYKFTFMQFFKVGFPVMLTSTIVITMYLMIAHVLFDWNG
ncbi:P protein [Lasioglossum baleicum]|uniref:P protein n=1 Tax=Lasioglossum baleicum TaxID=434251 RepID=UPI003FCE6625